MGQANRAAGAVGRISRVHFLRIRGSDGCAAQILRGRAADGEKMPTTTRFDLGGGGLPSMPNLSGAGKKILQLAILVAAIIVYQTVGDNYAEKIVEPTLRAAIRASTSAHTANALYTNARELVQQQIQDELTKELAPRGVIVENVLLRDVQLPAMLKGSIE